MEKYNEEMAREIISAACPAVAGTLLDGMVANVRKAGLLKPEETAHEKARRLREDWKDEYNGGVSYESACRLICRLIDPLIAEIDRLKAEAWAGDDDIIHAYKAGNNDMFSGDAQRYLAARRQAKRKE